MSCPPAGGPRHEILRLFPSDDCPLFAGRLVAIVPAACGNDASCFPWFHQQIRAASAEILDEEDARASAGHNLNPKGVKGPLRSLHTLRGGPAGGGWRPPVATERSPR